MTERAEHLAADLEVQLGLLTGLVASLRPEQVSAPCDDPQGADVAGVLLHLREGTDQFVDWAAHLTGGGPAPSTTGHGHGHPHQVRPPGPDAAGPSGTVDPRAQIDLTLSALRRGGGAVVPAVRGLSDAQLDVVPPPVPDLADGVMNLEQILDFISRDLAAHLGHLRAAVAAVASARP